MRAECGGVTYDLRENGEAWSYDIFHNGENVGEVDANAEYLMQTTLGDVLAVLEYNLEKVLKAPEGDVIVYNDV